MSRSYRARVGVCGYRRSLIQQLLTTNWMQRIPSCTPSLAHDARRFFGLDGLALRWRQNTKKAQRPS